jgi:hypothetical protein
VREVTEWQSRCSWWNRGIVVVAIPRFFL